MTRSVAAHLFLAAAVAVAPTIATAQPAPTPGPGDQAGPPKRPIGDDDIEKSLRPWAKGVSPEEQAAALALFKEGNGLIKDQLWPKAVAKYREALTHWKHPAIYYNLALALVNLDQPLEIYDALEKAMEYGVGPLDAEKLDRAKSTKLLVEKQIGQVEYTIDVASATLVFDGEEVFTGPGTYKARVRAGEHTVVARKEGYTPVPLTVKILGGTTSAITIPMYTDAELTRETRLMPNWVPYGILGAGVVLGATGALLHTSAKTNFSDYDQEIKDCAANDPTGGCSTLPAGVADMKTTAESRQSFAFIAYGVGGAALAAGVVLVILNRPKTFRVDPTAKAEPGVAVTPAVGPGLAGLVVAGSF